MDFVDKLLRILTGISLNQLCKLLLEAISALEGEFLSVWGKPAVVGAESVRNGLTDHAIFFIASCG